MFFQSTSGCPAGIHAPWLFRFDPARALLEDMDSGRRPDLPVQDLPRDSMNILTRKYSSVLAAQNMHVELVRRISVPTLLQEFPKLRDVSFIKVRGRVALR